MRAQQLVAQAKAEAHHAKQRCIPSFKWRASRSSGSG
jgi:hypothetical protein